MFSFKYFDNQKLKTEAQNSFFINNFGNKQLSRFSSKDYTIAKQLCRAI